MNIKKGRPAMLDKIREIIAVRIHDENDRSDEKGFTLIELLIVIIVLGILAAVTVFGLSGASSSSAKSACKADVRTTEGAIDAYHTQTADGSWPTAFTDLTAPNNLNAFPSGNPAPFLRTVPGGAPHYMLSIGPSTVTGDPSTHVFVGPGSIAPPTVGANDFDANLNSGTNLCETLVK
jgi:general secretion pathway protein G